MGQPDLLEIKTWLDHVAEELVIKSIYRRCRGQYQRSRWLLMVSGKRGFVKSAFISPRAPTVTLERRDL
jgi:hypothetical protein